MNFASEYVLAENKKKGDVDGGEPDTNVVSMKFNQLIETYQAHAGDPIKCGNCEAILSKISHLNDYSNELQPKNNHIWKCDFCQFENKIYIDKNEIPSQDEITYIIDPAPNKADENNNLTSELDSKYLIYCIDISGSMSVTTPVKGNFDLPTDKIRRDNLFAATGEHYMGNRNHSGVRHISRLEAVQLAITSNLDKLEKESPEKKVGLVTFNNKVKIIGDGFIDELQIVGDYLDKKDEIKKIADNTPNLKALNKTVLNEKLLNLEEGGATALGPALYYSILIAARKPGSQVILCTDGLANKGIGSLESTDEQEKIEFYSDIAKFAHENGVSVSILTIEGTNCKLGLIGDIADRTGGIINITDPMKLKDEFSNVLEEQIIATRVKATFILHKALFIRDHENINNRQSFTVKEIGNVTKETEVTLEFGLRDDAEIDTKIIQELPFQLQIEYYALDGCKALRVLTNLKKITENRQFAEDVVDRKILAIHAAQTKSKLVQKNATSKISDKLSIYLRRLAPKKDDDFEIETFDEIDRDLSIIQTSATRYNEARRNISSIMDSGSASAPARAVDSNAYENLTDLESNRAYRYKNVKSNFMAKKK